MNRCRRFIIDSMCEGFPLWLRVLIVRRTCLGLVREFRAAELLFSGLFRGGLGEMSILGSVGWSYDAAADGESFILFPGRPGDETDSIVVVSNWFGELRRLVPAGR